MPLPNGGGIINVLICTLTDTWTERLFQTALWGISLGFRLETAKEWSCKGQGSPIGRSGLPKWTRPLRASTAPWIWSRTGSRCSAGGQAQEEPQPKGLRVISPYVGITCGNWRLRSGFNKCTCKFGSIIHVFLVGEVQSVSKGFSLLPIWGICLGGWPYLGRTLVGGALTCPSISLRRRTNWQKWKGAKDDIK